MNTTTQNDSPQDETKHLSIERFDEFYSAFLMAARILWNFDSGETDSGYVLAAVHTFISMDVQLHSHNAAYLKDLAVDLVHEDFGQDVFWISLCETQDAAVKSDLSSEDIKRVVKAYAWPRVPDEEGLEFVYLLESGGVYKIGRTKNIDRRITEISPIMPYPVELIHAIPTIDSVSLERELHNRYADKRLNGEWFALTPDELKYISSL